MPIPDFPDGNDLGKFAWVQSLPDNDLLKLHSSVPLEMIQCFLNLREVCSDRDGG